MEKKATLKGDWGSNWSYQGLEAKEVTNGLTQRDEERIRKTYQIPPTINIRIPNLNAKHSDRSPNGWTIFHEKSFWLMLRFPLYPFVRKLFMRIQLTSSQLLTNGWRYLLCLTLICIELRVKPKIHDACKGYLSF